MRKKHLTKKIPPKIYLVDHKMYWKIFILSFSSRRCCHVDLLSSEDIMVSITVVSLSNATRECVLHPSVLLLTYAVCPPGTHDKKLFVTPQSVQASFFSVFAALFLKKHFQNHTYFKTYSERDQREYCTNYNSVPICLYLTGNNFF